MTARKTYRCVREHTWHHGHGIVSYVRAGGVGGVGSGAAAAAINYLYQQADTRTPSQPQPAVLGLLTAVVLGIYIRCDGGYIRTAALSGDTGNQASWSVGQNGVSVVCGFSMGTRDRKQKMKES